MRTFDHGFDEGSEFSGSKKLSRKKNKNIKEIRRQIDAMSDDEIFRMVEENTDHFSQEHTDETGRGIFRSMQNNSHGSQFQVQAKLEISHPNDHSERQADDLAQSVMHGNSKHNQDILSNPTSEVSRMSEGHAGGLQTSGEFDQQLQSTKGQGQKLDEETKSELEEHTGTDLSDVNIHTSGQAHEMSESINAKAFTHGQDIYFKQGNYNPDSKEGKELLAHEVAHTVQQSTGIQAKVQREPEDTYTSYTIKLPKEVKDLYDSWVYFNPNASSQEIAYRKIYYMYIIVYEQAHGIDFDTAQWIVDDMYKSQANGKSEQEYWLQTGDWKGFTDDDFAKGFVTVGVSKTRYDRYESIIRGTSTDVNSTTDLIKSIGGVDDVDAFIEKLKASDPSRYKRLVKEADDEYRSRTGFTGVINPKTQPDRKKQWDEIFKDVVKKDIIKAKITDYPDYVKQYLTDDKLDSPQFWYYIQMAELMKTITPEQYAQFQNEATQFVFNGGPQMGDVVKSLTTFIQTYKARISSIDNAKTDEEFQSIASSLTIADIMELTFEQRMKLIRALIKRAEYKDQQTIIYITGYIQTSDYNKYFDELVASDYALFQLMDDELGAPFYEQFHQQLKFYGIFAGGVDHYKEGVQKVRSDFNSDNPVASYGNGTNIIPFSAPGLFEAEVDFSYNITYSNGKINIEVFAAGLVKIKDASFNPLDIVGIYVITGKQGIAEDHQLLIVPAINLEYFHEKDKSQVWKNLMDGAFIILGVVGMIFAPEVVTFALAAIDTAYFVVNSIIDTYRDNIDDTPEGREFLESWDLVTAAMTVFGIAQAMVAMPELFALLRQGWNKLKTIPVTAIKDGKTIDVVTEMEKDVTTVLDGADQVASGEKIESGVKDPEAIKQVKTNELNEQKGDIIKNKDEPDIPSTENKSYKTSQADASKIKQRQPEIGGKSASSDGRGFSYKKGDRPNFLASEETGGLKGHAAKHGGEGQIIPTNPEAYLSQAIDNMNYGQQFKYYHDGQFKYGYIKKVGVDQYLFTGSTLNGKGIFTHMITSKKSLANIGITVLQ